MEKPILRIESLRVNIVKGNLNSKRGKKIAKKIKSRILEIKA